jgi:chitin-binding protein
MISIRSFRFIALGLTLATLGTLGVSAGPAWGHGLIQSPPSRNWFCGAITKPDEVSNGVAQFPVCGGAFAVNQVAGYNFMSVLTHTQGRSVVGPRTNVCGFNSESWNGVATVWDQPIDWPTSNMSAGPQTFTWNISWGPHFSDTQEFKYWITKPGFQFQVGRPLSFDDFEDQPFCTLSYNDANPSGNPDVIPDPAGALFRTRCNVPARSGRQVIYGEWGRNQFTFERFHSCMDVVFQSGPVIDAAIAVVPNVTEFTGTGTITLDASASVGTGLTYSWSVSAPNPSLYRLTNANQRTATLALTNPGGAAAKVVISLVVTSATGNDSATVTLVHRPTQPSPWFDLGVLSNAANTLIAGNRVSMRVVQSGGQDVFLPSTPVSLTATTAAADAWPFELAQAVNALNGSIRIGVLDAQNQIAPARNATSNHIFALATANVTGAFLQVALAVGPCRVNYRLDSQWGNGFQANLTINNTSATIPVVGYTLTWTMGTGETLNNGWNATFAPSGQTLSASNTAGNWNGVIAPNGNVSFGFVGNKGAAAALIPSDFRLNGQPCSTGPVASATRASGKGSMLASPVPPPAHSCDHVPGPAPQPARRVSQVYRTGSRMPKRLQRAWRRRW